MKKLLGVMMLAVMLSGCAGAKSELERGMALRTRLLAGSGCSFAAEITADYGDKFYSFSMDCQGSDKGELTFAVTLPETISGITGAITRENGRLTFDDKVLAFPLLADDQLTPVSAPWIFLKTLRSGYLTAAGMEGDRLRLSIDDSYREDALHLDIWLNGEDVPEYCEIRYHERKILSLKVKDFQIL